VPVPGGHPLWEGGTIMAVSWRACLAELCGGRLSQEWLAVACEMAAVPQAESQYDGLVQVMACVNGERWECLIDL